jgi:hypothetical protein
MNNELRLRHCERSEAIQDVQRTIDSPPSLRTAKNEAGSNPECATNHRLVSVIANEVKQSSMCTKSSTSGLLHFVRNDGGGVHCSWIASCFILRSSQ